MTTRTTSKETFREVKSSVSYPEMEEQLLHLWRERKVFQRSMDERKDGPRFVFFEGPPTANGRPGIHHVLARAFKDMFPRYKTMQGYYVLRKGGWDTHGLPVELEVEKQLGLTGKELQRPSQLSGGQQQRVAVARALASRPSLVLADEPTANLDSKSTEALLDVMRDLNHQEGTTFLFSTHDQRVIDRAETIFRLEDGQLAR